jgi:hypothetical protein
VGLDLEGKLSVFEPISVLQLLDYSRSTGELSLDIGKNSARVYFDRGRVIFAEISNREQKLGQFLVTHNLVKQDAVDRVLAKKRRGRRLGELLLEDGAISERELRVAVEEQIKEVVYEVVRWKRGSFRFDAGKKPASQDIFIDIPLDNLMLEGLKRLDEEGENGE